MSELPPVIDPLEKQHGLAGYWHPGLLGMVNETAIKLARIQGEFIWHSHELEDELFIVLEGRLRMEFRVGNRELGPGQMIIVPHGMEHRPVSIDGDCLIMLIEPTTTVNTGNVESDLMRDNLELL